MLTDDDLRKLPKAGMPAGCRHPTAAHLAFVRHVGETKAADLKASALACGLVNVNARQLYTRLKPLCDHAIAHQEALEYRATDAALIKLVKEQAGIMADTPAVQAAISARTITQEYVINQLLANSASGQKGDPIFDKEGNILGYRQNLAASNKALELLGKQMGMFGYEIDDKSKGGERYSDIEELKERVKKRSMLLGLPIPGVFTRVLEPAPKTTETPTNQKEFTENDEESLDTSLSERFKSAGQGDSITEIPGKKAEIAAAGRAIDYPHPPKSQIPQGTIDSLCRKRTSSDAPDW